MDKLTYRIKGMDCADCALKIEKGVRQLPGVEAVDVNFGTGNLSVQGMADPEKIKHRVESLGYSLEEKGAYKSTSAQRENFGKYLLSRAETRLALVGGGLLLASLIASWLGVPLALIKGMQVLALLIAGYPIARSALVNLWINHDFSINLLTTIAAVGAMIIGQTAESATLIFLFSISEELEGYTSDRARSVLNEISDLTPSQAIRIHAGAEERVPVDSLSIGDEILVRAGDRIPMDGMVSAGQSAVDQSPITGESLPVSKEPGSEVFAGTVNGSGTLSVLVTRLAKDATLQRIIQMIEQAQSVRAPTQRFIDRFAQVYTPAVVVLAVLVASVPPLLFGQPFLNPPGGEGWLYRALALLVIACPCALVISAPVTVISAITNAAQHGVLFKGGAFLEALAAIKVFAFDKTGTLTQGKPEVTTFRSVDCANPGISECSDCQDVLALASALERYSTHPLAHSVIAAAESRGIENRYAPAQDLVTLAGSGLQGEVNGKLATIGNHQLFEQQHPHTQTLCRWVQDAENNGQTTMLLCDGDRVRGFIAVADTVRADSQSVVAELKTMRKQTVMLTGDNASVAGTVGERVGVNQVRANLLPEDKVNVIQELHHDYGRVAMVGDGINDTPALAAASLGIAMGGAGSAQALETADIVLMGDDIKQLPFAVKLSDFARRLIRQNIAISLATKVIFILLALSGLATLWMAVLADVGLSLAVTANGMRANRYQ